MNKNNEIKTIATFNQISVPFVIQTKRSLIVAVERIISFKKNGPGKLKEERAIMRLLPSSSESSDKIAAAAQDSQPLKKTKQHKRKTSIKKVAKKSDELKK